MASNPTIEDFFVDEKPTAIDIAVEESTNKYIKDYAWEIEKNEARAYEQSMRIFRGSGKCPWEGLTVS